MTVTLYQTCRSIGAHTLSRVLENQSAAGNLAGVAHPLADQRSVFDFLSSTEAYGADTNRVDVVTTHGAAIFLGCRDVYKVKQAVRYDYMDFSSLQRREAVCKREVQINKPFAPSVYRKAVAITRDEQGQFAIDGEGEIVEWAIHMNRFPEEDVLERIAERNEFDARLAALLGKQVADYHRGLMAENTHDGGLRIKEIINELNDAFEDRDLRVPCDLAVEFRAATKAAFEPALGHLDERAARGLVRRCHGDLHLRNIVLIDGTPTPFDALEFDERLATTDVLYDLAFLLMDMLHRGLNHQANIVFNRYVHFSWELTRDHGFRILPLFLAIRAAIRAMVRAQTALRSPAEAAALRHDCEKYLLESVAFFRPTEPKLIAVGGLSGSGKSSLCESLAPDVGKLPGALLLRSDLERKKMLDAHEFERLPVEAYDETTNRCVYKRLFERARIALEQGQSVILDAVFADGKNRLRAAEIAGELDIGFCGLWLDAPADVLIERVEGRRNDASDANAAVVKKQLESQRQHGETTSGGWRSVDASGSVEETRRNAESKLGPAFLDYCDNSLSPRGAP